MANPIQAIEQATKLIDQLIQKLELTEDQIVSISGSASKTAKNFFDIKLPKELNEQLKQSKQFSQDLNSVLKERQTLQKKLVDSQTKLASAQSSANKEVIKNRLETQKVNREVKEGILLNSKFASAYEKLSVKHRQAARNLKNLVVQQQNSKKSSKALNNEVRVAQKEFDILDKKLRKADNSANDFRRDVGKYKNALRPTINLVRGLAGAFGLYSAIEIGKSIFEDIKALNALDEALLKVVGSTTALNETKSFLSKVADDNGVEIKALTSEYTKYLAALKGTNLEGTKGERIFQKVIKSSAALGNSQDKTNGILNAFVQIISKGTVQAEELRGQLGDRLPGAVNIMARALEVSTEELNKMLEKGQLIADEVLPKFADELEKTFGLENVNRIDTLVAAQERLENSWTSFVGAIENGKGPVANAYKFIVEGLADVLKGLAFASLDADQKLNSLFDTQKAESYAAAINEIDRAVLESGKTREEEAQLTFDSNIERFDQLNNEINLLKDRKKQLEEQKQTLSALDKVFGNNTETELSKVNTQIKELSISLAISEGQLSAAQKVLSEFASSQIDSDKATKENKKSNKDLKISLKGTINSYNDLIKVLEEEQNSSATTTKKYLELESRIKALKSAISDLKGEVEKGGISQGFDVEIDFSLPSDDQIVNKLQSDLEKLKSAYDSDVANYKLGLEEKLDLANEFTDNLNALGNSIFERNVQRYDDEIQRNNDYYAELLNNERLSEEERSQLEAQREAKNAELEKKKREEQRKQAIFDKAISIAQIGINTAQGISKVIATVPPPANVPLIAFAAAQGALQLATVLATPIPQYEFGKPESDNYEGPAIWGEKRTEVKFNTKTGEIEYSPSTPSLTNVRKDDVIYPSVPAFEKNFTSEQVVQSALLTSLYSQKQNAENSAQIFDSILSKYQGQIKKEIKYGLKAAKFNIYNDAPQINISEVLRIRGKIDV